MCKITKKPKKAEKKRLIEDLKKSAIMSVYGVFIYYDLKLVGV